MQTLGAPRHLKKAWLQRHTGEDYNSAGTTGSGVCIKLPITLDQPIEQTTKTDLTNEQDKSNTLETQKPTKTETEATSIHSFNIGTMAVNNVNKTKSIGNLFLFLIDSVHVSNQSRTARKQITNLLIRIKLLGANKGVPPKKAIENTNPLTLISDTHTKDDDRNSELDKNDEDSSSDQVWFAYYSYMYQSSK